jgi:hypothetical protein
MSFGYAMRGVFALALLGCLLPLRADGLPFNIAPKELEIHVDSQAALHAWHMRFDSLAEFVNAVRQFDFKTLASGETDVAYYAIFRCKTDVFVFAYGFKDKEKRNGGFDLTGPNGSHAMFVPPDLKIFQLLKITVKTSSSLAGLTVNESVGSALWGFATRVKPDFKGPLTMKFQLWTQDENKPRSMGSQIVAWN